MQNKLLNKLQEYTQHKKLKQYCLQNNNDASVRLNRLTKLKIVEISKLKKTRNNLNILIVETDEIEFLAAFMAGIIESVNIFLGDRAWGKQEWQQVFDLVAPDLVFGDRADLKYAIASNTRQAVVEVKQQESLIMIPTGGTSGKVRFAMHTWSTLKASVLSFQQYFDCPVINSFCTLPLHHVSGLMQFLRSFLTQGNLILCPYKAIEEQDRICQPEDYFISLVPTQLQYLIDLIPDYLARFKTVLVGGAPAMRSLLDKARKYRIPVATTYGMTETASGIVTLKPQDFLAGNNSSGQVLPQAEISIEADSDNAPTQIGLIRIKCPSLYLGYYPQTSGSHLLTDDLGYFDSDRYLHIVGRNSQKIITGGENVFPTEVETVIWSTKLVRDICVIGIKDSKWGQIVTAIYVPIKFDLDLNLLQQKIKSQLAKYKLPKVWIEVDKIPRNDRGKINYQQLQEIVKNSK